jgi:hypothetical protein
MQSRLKHADGIERKTIETTFDNDSPNKLSRTNDVDVAFKTRGRKKQCRINDDLWPRGSRRQGNQGCKLV